MRPEIVIIDCSTGKETIREMNDEEYTQYLKDQEVVDPLPNDKV